jgi:hypothetical protein
VSGDPSVTHRFPIRGRLRDCPDTWWEPLIGPKPEADFDCNGCTASPDVYMGFHLWPACRIHDWHYDEKGPDISRFRADATFRLNIWRVMRAQGAPIHRAWYVAGIYYAAVRAAGGRAYRPRVPAPVDDLDEAA